MKSNMLLREFTKYSMLNVLGMLGLSCYILADTFFVSKGLGANGLTALNLAIPVYNFIHGSGLMLGMGAATKYSIFKSQNQPKKANIIFTNTVYLAILTAALFVVVGLFFSRSITRLFGADSEVFEMTVVYIKVILLFAPAFILNDLMICFVRNDGNPNLSMFAMIVGSLSNVVLDYIFIFPLQMGIFGAVFATGLAPIISMLILSLHKIRKKNAFHLIKTIPSPSLAGNTLSLGLPSLITEMSSGIVIIIFNAIILRLRGNIGVAAYGVVANISLVIVAIYTGLAQGIQPIISRAHGVRDTRSTKTVLRYALTAMAGFSLLVYLIIFFQADGIINIFNSEGNATLQQIANLGLKIYFTGGLFIGFNIILSVYDTSTEKPGPAHIISLLRGFFIIIPMAYLLSSLLDMIGVWLAFPVTEGIVAVVGAVLYFKFQKNRQEGKKNEHMA